MLGYFNNNKETVLSVDASNTGLGAVIMQEGKSVAFISNTLTPSENMYANIERELLAIVWGAQTFHTCIWAQSLSLDRPQTVGVNLSEMKPLPGYRGCCSNSPSIVVGFVPGKQQVISDCLSRAPLGETKPFSEPEDVTRFNLVEELGLESSTQKRFKDSSSADEKSRVAL